LREVSSTLESITLPRSFMLSMTPIILHGPGLRKLALTRRIHSQDAWRDGKISTEDLIRLRDGLPHLEELTVSVAKIAHDGEKWPYYTLDILAGFRKLRWLNLSMELAIPEDKFDTPEPPYLTMSSAESLFCYLREHSEGECFSLQRLEVSSGESDSSLWLDANSTSFIVCKLPCEGNQEGRIEVTCTKLGVEQNQRMRHIISGHEKPLPTDLSKVDFKVALDGPMSKSQLEIMRQNDPLPPYFWA